MSLTLRAAAVHVPGPLRRAAVHELLRVTAGAFRRPLPPLGRLDADELLRVHAHLSAAWAREAIADGGDLAPLEARLEAGARGLGAELRERLHVVTAQDAMDAARVVYRLLRIDFSGTPDGTVTIRHCSYSDVYSARVCRLMGALDAGLLAGLTGGGRLEFSRRITEGAPCCLARLGPPEAAP
jgi:hypothetical protein